MRIDHGPTRQALVPTVTPPPSAPSHSFAALLQSPRLSAKAAEKLLSGAWTAVVGEPPSPATSRLLTAHWALETDAGRAMPGFNFAGLKASPQAQGALLATVEGHGSTRREVSARFRVYDSPEAGARDYVSLLKTRYPVALEAARLGKIAEFSQALAAGGYFTADPAAYSSGLQYRASELGKSAPAPHSTAPLGPPLAEAALASLLRAFRPASDEA